jgi:hypothetical protein
VTANGRAANHQTPRKVVSQAANVTSQRSETRSPEKEAPVKKNPLAYTQRMTPFLPERQNTLNLDVVTNKGNPQRYKEPPTLSLVYLGEPEHYKIKEMNDNVFFQLLWKLGGPGEYALILHDGKSETAFCMPKTTEHNYAPLKMPRRFEEMIVIDKKTIKPRRVQDVRNLIKTVQVREKDDSLKWANNIIAIGEKREYFVQEPWHF